MVHRRCWADQARPRHAPHRFKNLRIDQDVRYFRKASRESGGDILSVIILRPSEIGSECILKDVIRNPARPYRFGGADQMCGRRLV